MTTKTTITLSIGTGVAILIGWLALGTNRIFTDNVVTPARPMTGNTRPTATPGISERNAPPPGSMRPVLSAVDSQNLEIDPIVENALVKEKEERQANVEGYLAALKSRFLLTGEQVAAVRKGLDASEEFSSAYLTMPDVAWQALVDEKLRGVLTVEQTQAFEGYLDEQRRNRVEVNTAREMANLQENMTLSPLQKDDIYRLLGDYAESHDRDPNPEAVRDAAHILREGMSKILSPDQMKVYQQTPAAPVVVKKGDLSVRSGSIYEGSSDPSHDGNPDAKVGVSIFEID